MFDAALRGRLLPPTPKALIDRGNRMRGALADVTWKVSPTLEVFHSLPLLVEHPLLSAQQVL